MAVLSNVDVDNSSWLKWQIAVAIGAPVVIGFGYWYFVKNKKDVDTQKSVSSTNDNCKAVPNPSAEQNGTNKIDKTSEEKTKTPPVSAPVTQSSLQLSQDLKTSGNNLFKSGKYLDAIKCYTEAIEICPREERNILSTYYQNRAAAHEQLNNIEDVKNDCTLALELNPKYTKAYLRRAKANEATGDLKQCLEDITSVCILECFQNSSSLLMADRVLKQLGKLHSKEAIKNKRPVKPSKSFVRSYFTAFANDPIKHYFIEDPYSPKKQDVNGYNDTESFEREMLEKIKKSLDSENYDQIVADCTEALETAPEHSLLEVLLLRGSTYILRGQHTLALADFKTIMDTNDGDAKIQTRIHLLFGFPHVNHCREMLTRGMLTFLMLTLEENRTEDGYVFVSENVIQTINKIQTRIHLLFGFPHVNHCREMLTRGMLTFLMLTLEENRTEDGYVFVSENVIQTINKIQTRIHLLFGFPHVNHCREMLTRGMLTFLMLTLEENRTEDGYVFVSENVIQTINKVRVNALIKCASLYIQTDEDDKAFDNFKLAEQIDPENSDVYHHRGQIYLVMDKLDESVADFKKAVELNPTYPICLVQYLYTQYRLAATKGDVILIENILQEFKQTVEKFPTCIEAYTLYAQILTDQQKYLDEANINFDIAIELDPTNPTLRVQKALLNLQWTGDVNATVDMINEAIAVDGSCEFSYETLGTIEVQRGNLQRAIELFDKALPLAKSEMELSHIYSLRDAAVAQMAVAQRLGLPISTPLPL